MGRVKEFIQERINNPKLDPSLGSIALGEIFWRFNATRNTDNAINSRAIMLRNLFGDPNLDLHKALEIAAREFKAWGAETEGEKRVQFEHANTLIVQNTHLDYDPGEAAELEVILNNEALERDEVIEAHAKLHALTFNLPEEAMDDLIKASASYSEAIDYIGNVLEAAAEKNKTVSRKEMLPASEHFFEFYSQLAEIREMYPEPTL